MVLETTAWISRQTVQNLCLSVFLRYCRNLQLHYFWCPFSPFDLQAWRRWWCRQSGAWGHASLPQPAAVLPGQADSGAHGHQIRLLRQARSCGECLPLSWFFVGLSWFHFAFWYHLEFFNNRKWDLNTSRSLWKFCIYSATAYFPQKSPVFSKPCSTIYD